MARASLGSKTGSERPSSADGRSALWCVTNPARRLLSVAPTAFPAGIIAFASTAVPLSPLSTNVLNGTFDPFAPGPAGGFESYFAPVCQYQGQTGCGFADPNTLPVAQGSKITMQQARGGAYYFGNYPRNNGDARNPNYFNEDFSLIRNFHITESVYIQAKGELLNAFNRHIFAVADAAPTGPYDPQFGRVTGTIDGFGFAQRILQVTLRLNF